jgi:hypothetical protein
MELLLAAAGAAFLAWLYARRKSAVTFDQLSDPGGGPAPGPDPEPESQTGAVIFWQHKTPMAYECLGYCDIAWSDGRGLWLEGSRIIDLTRPAGIIIEPQLRISINDLVRRQGGMAGHVLYHLVEDGILEGPAGAMMFPGDNSSHGRRIRKHLKRELDKRHLEGASGNFGNWLARLPNLLIDLLTLGTMKLDSGSGLAAGAFTILRPQATLYAVRGSKWSQYWSGSVYPVSIEVSPSALYHQSKVGER